MAMRSKLRLLTPADRDEFHALVRRNFYGNLEGVQVWLAEKGLVFSRSGVHRYISRLRLADVASGRVEARMASQAGTQQRARRELLERLGALELERQGLIYELGLAETRALHAEADDA